MKKMTFTVVITIGLVFFIPSILSFGIKDIPENTQSSLDATEKVYGGTAVSQTMTPKNNNFSAVGLTIKNPYLLNKKDIFLDVYGADGKVLRQAVFNGSLITDGEFVKFEFSPIPESKNTTFTFNISSPDSNQDEAFELFSSSKPTSFGNLKVNGKEEARSLAFAGFYRPEGKLSAFSLIANGWLAKFTGDTLFFIFYTALILTGAIYLLYGKLKKV